MVLKYELQARGRLAEMLLLPAQVTPVVPLTFRGLATQINRGQTLRTSVDWQNIGDVTYAFDVLSLIGDYDPTTGVFTIEYGWGVLDVSVNAGVAVTTNVDGVIPDWASGGLRDGLVLICDYDPATGAITTIYAALVTEDAINVTGVGASISAVSYSVV